MYKAVERFFVGLVGCFVLVEGLIIFLVGSEWLHYDALVSNLFLPLFFELIARIFESIHILIPAVLFFGIVGVYYLFFSIKASVPNIVMRFSVLSFLIFVFMLPPTYFLGDFMCQTGPADGFCFLLGLPPMLIGLLFLALWLILFIVGAIVDIVRLHHREAKH